MSRLIDADRLVAELADWQYSEAPDESMSEPERNTAEIVYQVIEDCIEAVNDMPTVYPAE